MQTRRGLLVLGKQMGFMFRPLCLFRCDFVCLVLGRVLSILEQQRTLLVKKIHCRLLFVDPSS